MIRRGARALAAAIAFAGWANAANADVPIDLQVRPRTRLTMRQSVSVQDPEPDGSSGADDAEKENTADVGPTAAKTGDRFLDIGPATSGPALEDRLILRANLGFGIDGGQLRCTDAGCTPPPSGISSEEFDANYYSRLRAYAYGDAVVGSRGIGAASLNTYFAASFRFDQGGVIASAVPSVYDASEVRPVLVRHGYVETDGFFEQAWLKPVYLRAGRQFRYGPAIAHFDGVSAGYASRAISLGVFTGRNVSLYGFDNDNLDGSGVILGADARIDMFELKGVPLVISGSALFFDEQTHLEGGLALRWSRDAVMRASVRLTNGTLASQRLSLRTRISKVTTVSADIESQAATDWPFDLILSRPASEYGATDARRYLDFGFQLPRVYMNFRAGTVFLDNVDFLLRIGGAVDRDGVLFSPNSDSASYLETGAALEVRLRRAVGLGISALARFFSRERPRPIMDDDAPNELPSQIGAIGERSFTEGGAVLRFEPGRRSFSAIAELYGRLYRLQSPYIDGADGTDFRSGGRFSVRAWISERLRLKVEYDVAFSPRQLAPAIRSIKRLRVVAEGTY